MQQLPPLLFLLLSLLQKQKRSGETLYHALSLYDMWIIHLILLAFLKGVSQKDVTLYTRRRTKRMRINEKPSGISFCDITI
jgi:hypothetical protein